ncbi:MAG: tRNA (adenosine(37)-N6)-threonylcarbamoyltransferase complex dimerization subunit type 1 TsaB [Bradymonadaceae bacterium]
MPDAYNYVLGIDTATPIQSVAVLDGDRAMEDCKRRVKFDHSSSLLLNISEGFEDHDLEVTDLDLIAVGIGPGSFTGVRIGLSLAKGLARAADLPLVGVSSLAALTYPHAIVDSVDYVIGGYDARRREAYTGTYQYTGDDFRQIDPDRLASPEEVRKRALDLAARNRQVQIVGNASEAFDELGGIHRKRVQILPPWLQGPSAIAVAMLGRRQMHDRGADSLHELEPNYIRASSAEENYQEEQAEN